MIRFGDLEFECPFFIFAGDTIFVEIKAGWVEAATVASNPAMTNSIFYNDRTYEGFTELHSIVLEDGNLRLRLTKERAE